MNISFSMRDPSAKVFLDAELGKNVHSRNEMLGGGLAKSQPGLRRGQVVAEAIMDVAAATRVMGSPFAVEITVGDEPPFVVTNRTFFR